MKLDVMNSKIYKISKKKEDMNIVFKLREELKPYGNNPRKITKQAIKLVANSINEFGFKVPVIIDNKNEVIAGHVRLKAAELLKLEKVPCIVVDDLNEEQIKAFRLSDNRVSEFSLWDNEMLHDELKELNSIFRLDDFGFFDELDLLQEIKEDEFDIDESLIEATVNTYVELGDIYQLGEHRLMCGDATNSEHVKKLIGKDKIDLLLTDPPYNVSYKGKTKDKLTIANDSMDDSSFYEFLRDSFMNVYPFMKKGAGFYIWHADTKRLPFILALKEAGLNPREVLIWVKNNFVMGRQDYQWKHEPCLYGWKDGHSHYFIKNRKQNTVLDFKKPNKNSEHPTMKPVELFGRQIRNSTLRGRMAIVLDMFGGSGTSLIASEQLDRKCLMMELSPVYCQVIIQRYETLTGATAYKLENDDGETEKTKQ